MNYKLLILIALVASVLLSGCIENGKLDKTYINQSYKVVDYTIDLSDNNVDVIYLDNSTIAVINFHMQPELKDTINHMREGIIIFDNETYLKKDYSIEDNLGARTDWYELHINQNSYPKGIVKSN